jgi:hypothetical protein
VILVNNFTTIPQGPSHWCWAHVGTEVSLHYPAPKYSRPCDLANDQLNETTCCQNGSSSNCNQDEHLDTSLTLTGNLDSTQPGALLISQIKQRIDADQPIGVRIEWGDGSGHFVVVGGYDDTLPAGSEEVQVFDSLYGDNSANLVQFTSAYLGSGRWTDTYFTKP